MYTQPMERGVVLGSAGSIGTQTLDIIAQHPEDLPVVGLAARKNAAGTREQAERFGVGSIALFESQDPTIPSGMNAIVDLATMPEADIVVVAVAGVIGLLPTI